MGPAATEAKLHIWSWGFQVDLTDELKTGLALSSASLTRLILLMPDQETCFADSSDPPESMLLVCSSYKELYVLGLEADDQSKPASSLTPTDSEMVEVMNHAKARLKLDWSMEWEEPAPGKLDKWFLLGHKQPQFVSLPFLQELHNEMVKSWKKHYSFHVYFALIKSTVM